MQISVEVLRRPAVSLWRSRTGEAIRYSIVNAQPGDMIAVIGKGHEDYQEINGVRYPFLDRQVIEEVVTELEKSQKEV